MANYSADSQMNYLIQWFKTWSEFQKDDFVTIFSQRLTETGAGGDGDVVTINGIANGIRNLDTSGRPPSLFSCQLKLFNEWWSTWSPSDREKMTTRFKEADPSFFEAVKNEMKGTREKLNEDFMFVSAEDANSEQKPNGGFATGPIPVFTVKPIIIHNNANGSSVIEISGDGGTGIGGDDSVNSGPGDVPETENPENGHEHDQESSEPATDGAIAI